jgi:hypothetical protein
MHSTNVESTNRVCAPVWALTLKVIRACPTSAEGLVTVTLL